MNSKEALDEIIRSFNETTTGINGLGEVVVDNCLIRCNKAELKIIKKDLDRLEILEQENESLKLTIKCQNASEEQMKLYALGLEKENKTLIKNADCCMWKECSKITQENQKLKKVIDIIIKNKIKPSAFIAGLDNYRNVYDEEMPFSKAIYLLDLECSEEEFELLKEVLCDEQNS